MNTERAAWAIMAGSCAVLLTMTAAVFWLLTEGSPPGFGVGGVPGKPGPGTTLVVYTVEAILMVATGVLPSLALGAG